MKSFSDGEIMHLMQQHYEYAKDTGKEGAGTHRNAGDSGRVAMEWIRLRIEARKRGLI